MKNAGRMNSKKKKILQISCISCKNIFANLLCETILYCSKSSEQIKDIYHCK